MPTFDIDRRRTIEKVGVETVDRILSSDDEIVAFELFKRNILPFRDYIGDDPALARMYHDWMITIVLRSKHRGIRITAIEQLYEQDDIEGLFRVIKETPYDKDRRICINLILESCREYVSGSPLVMLSHKLGVGTGGIRVKPRNWLNELSRLPSVIPDYELRKETAVKVYQLLKQYRPAKA